MFCAIQAAVRDMQADDMHIRQARAGFQALIILSTDSHIDAIERWNQPVLSLAKTLVTANGAVNVA